LQRLQQISQKQVDLFRCPLHNVTSQQGIAMFASVGDMVDCIQAYQKVTDTAGFVANGTGTKAWSNRYTGPKGHNVDIRGSDWTLFDPNGEVMATGKTPTELKWSLLLAA
jgi:hypothetical protein